MLFRWCCICCKEVFNTANYRYKLILEVSDDHCYKKVVIFGSELNIIFGLNANEFFK